MAKKNEVDEEFGAIDENSTEESSVEETPAPSYVSKEEFNQKFDDLQKLILLAVSKPEEAKKIDVVSKEIQEAGADIGDVNPRYDAKAKEILGTRVERTFVTYPKGGGTLFTIVITKEASNSPKDYLERMKEDRRTVNLEREEFRGEDGVEKWAKLILSNLNRTLR